MRSCNLKWKAIPAILLVCAFFLCACNLTSRTPVREKPADEKRAGREEKGSHEQDVRQFYAETDDANPEEQVLPPLDKKTSVIISAVGDVMMHMPQIRAGQIPGGGYDFRSVFQEVRPYIEKADIALANFETTIGTRDRGYSGYPRFSAPHEILEALRFAGFDVLTTANNHCLDWLEFGVENTLNKMDEYGIMHTGTARTPEESQKLLIIEKNEIKVGILAYTYGTNGMEVLISQDKLSYMVNYFSDFDKVRRDIKRIREAGAEVVVVCMHWGNEYERTPGEEQKDLAQRLANAGADIIFGSHPHVIQPVEIMEVVLEDGAKKNVFVAYSLGNFISNQKDRYTDIGVIVNVEVVKDHNENTISIVKVTYVPTWVYRYYKNGKAQYRILPVKKYINGAGELQGVDERRIRDVWQETTGLLNNIEVEQR